MCQTTEDVPLVGDKSETRMTASVLKQDPNTQTVKKSANRMIKQNVQIAGQIKAQNNSQTVINKDTVLSGCGLLNA